MASIERQGAKWRIVLRYNGQKFQRALETSDRQEAQHLRSRVEENLKLLRRGRLGYRQGDDLVTLLLSDGKLNGEPRFEKQRTLGSLLKDYRRESKSGKEENTRYTERIHIKHLLRLFGRRTLVGAVIHKKLQEYANKRAQEKGRSGNPISHVTIKKEIGTLLSIWNKWALPKGLVPASLVTTGLQYDKVTEKPPFQTWEQVTSKSKGDPKSSLWDSVFLSPAEIEQLLNDVRRRRPHLYYPMFAFCAYTGARRSEMLRARVQDLDLERGVIMIREKKKDHTRRETYRHVPLTAELRKSLQDWLKTHPGGDVLFCSKAGECLSEQMANHYFRRALKTTKWSVLRGWHLFRHSFISNMASRGTSDNVIMALVGHLNSETTRRYLHLRPDTLEAAITSLFGDRPLVVADAH